MGLIVRVFRRKQYIFSSIVKRSFQPMASIATTPYSETSISLSSQRIMYFPKVNGAPSSFFTTALFQKSPINR